MKKALWVVMFLWAGNLWAMSSRPPKPREVAVPPPAALSLTLSDCYQMALRQSETLALKKEEVSRTLASFLRSSGDAIGDFDYVATDFLQDSTQSGDSDTVSTSTAHERRQRKFVISQPLFQGFRAIGGLSGAGSLKKQRLGEWERAKQLLFLDVVNAYYDYLRLNKDVEIIEGILSLFEDRLKDLKGWVEIGRSRPSELATAQSRLQVFQGDLAQSKGERAAARNLLAFLIGVSVEAQELKEETADRPVEKSTDILELSRRRPDVQAAEAAIKTARGALIVAQSELWPKLSLDSNLYEKREGFQSGNSWDALFTLTVPLGTGGTTMGKVKDAYSAWKETKISHTLALRTAEREIQDAYDRLQASQERHQSLEKGVSSAQENFNFQKDEYQKHLVSNLDVLEALQSLFETKRGANESFYAAKKNYWQLQVAKGIVTEKPA